MSYLQILEYHWSEMFFILYSWVGLMWRGVWRVLLRIVELVMGLYNNLLHYLCDNTHSGLEQWALMFHKLLELGVPNFYMEIILSSILIPIYSVCPFLTNITTYTYFSQPTESLRPKTGHLQDVGSIPKLFVSCRIIYKFGVKVSNNKVKLYSKYDYFRLRGRFIL